MSVRGDLLGFIVNVHLPRIDRSRIVQTLTMLESGPFTSPKWQGDPDNECAKLRRWVNKSPTIVQSKTYPAGAPLEDYYRWVRKCPFFKELANVPHLDSSPIWDSKYDDEQPRGSFH